MNKRVSTLVSALLIATALGWQQPVLNVAAATHNTSTTKTVKHGKHAKTHSTKHKATSTSKHIKLQGASNARDLGGYINKNGQKIKAHRLIRSNSLSKLSKSD